MELHDLHQCSFGTSTETQCLPMDQCATNMATLYLPMLLRQPKDSLLLACVVWAPEAPSIRTALAGLTDQMDRVDRQARLLLVMHLAEEVAWDRKGADTDHHAAVTDPLEADSGHHEATIMVLHEAAWDLEGVRLQA